MPEVFRYLWQSPKMWLRLLEASVHRVNWPSKLCVLPVWVAMTSVWDRFANVSCFAIANNLGPRRDRMYVPAQVLTIGMLLGRPSHTAGPLQNHATISLTKSQHFRMPVPIDSSSTVPLHRFAACVPLSTPPSGTVEPSRSKR